MKRDASGARAACRPAPWTRSSAPPSTCTPCSSIGARAASCVCRPARSIASRCVQDRHPPRTRPNSIAHAMIPTPIDCSGGRKRAAARSPPRRQPRTRSAHRPRRERAAVNAAKRRAIFARLQESNPAPRTELKYRTPFELLVAVILSAQATDKSVNKATASLFRTADTPAAMLALGVAGITQYIKSIGLYNSKAKNIIATCQALLAQHAGRVPRTREALEQLPGRRAQDRERRAEHRIRRIHHRRRHAHLSSRQPHRARARQDRARRGRQADEDRAARISPRCASLADPARPLCVHGAQAGLSPLSDRRPLRIPAQDAGRPALAGSFPMKTPAP